MKVTQKRSKLFMECMDFLYVWVEKGVITNGIRKGAPEELEAFIQKKLADDEMLRAARTSINNQNTSSPSQESLTVVSE